MGDVDVFITVLSTVTKQIYNTPCVRAIKIPLANQGYFVLGDWLLLSNLRNHTSTNSTATFADSEVKTLLHSDRCEEFNLEG